MKYIKIYNNRYIKKVSSLIITSIILSGCQNLIYKVFNDSPNILQGKRFDVISEKEDQPFLVSDISIENSSFPKLSVTRSIEWDSKYLFPFIEKPLIYDNNLYFIDHYGVINKFSIENNKFLWKNKSLSCPYNIFHNNSRIYKQGRLLIVPKTLINNKSSTNKDFKEGSIVVATSGDNNLIALDAETGSTIWNIKIGNIVRSDIYNIDNYRILLSTADDAIYIISVMDGKILWSDIGKRSIGYPKIFNINTIFDLNDLYNTTSLNQKNHHMFMKYMSNGEIKIFYIPQLHCFNYKDKKLNQKIPSIISSTTCMENNIPQEIMKINNKKFANTKFFIQSKPIFHTLVTDYSDKDKKSDDLLKLTLYTLSSNGSVVALNLSEQKTIWASDYKTDTTICNDDLNLYLLNDDKSSLTAVNKFNGSLLWSINIKPLLKSDGIINSTFIGKKYWLKGPMIFLDYILLIEGNSGDMYIFNKNNGALIHKYNFGKKLIGAYIIDKKIILIKNIGEISIIENIN